MHARMIGGTAMLAGTCGSDGGSSGCTPLSHGSVEHAQLEGDHCNLYMSETYIYIYILHDLLIFIYVFFVAFHARTVLLRA